MYSLVCASIHFSANFSQDTPCHVPKCGITGDDKLTKQVDSHTLNRDNEAKFKFSTATDDSAKGGLTYFEELTVIPCAPKDFKR